jgi:hypothetical protein
MMQVIHVAVIVVAVWSLLSFAAALVVGRWLARAGAVAPTPVGREHTHAA